MNFNFRQWKQVQHAEAFIVAIDDDRSARWRAGKKLGVRHVERTAIGHMQRERPKRSRLMNIVELLTRHSLNIAEMRANGPKIPITSRRTPTGILFTSPADYKPRHRVVMSRLRKLKSLASRETHETK
jgi:hypothetical protein